MFISSTRWRWNRSDVEIAGGEHFVGQLGSWSPIGVEATPGGYPVAWKLAGADQYTVWSTDTNGNYTVQLVDSVSGGSDAVQSFETSVAEDSTVTA